VHSDSACCPEVRIWEISEPETIQFSDGSGGDCICHTQRAENGGKNAANDNK